MRALYSATESYTVYTLDLGDDADGNSNVITWSVPQDCNENSHEFQNALWNAFWAKFSERYIIRADDSE